MASDSSPVNTPDDAWPNSPVSNTVSSPGDRSRWKRRRDSSYATPSPMPSASRARTPEATPTPASNARRRGRDVGEGNEDEAPAVYIWGTNISVQDVNAAILRFLRHFREDPEQIEGKYMRMINHVIEIEGDSLDVDAHGVYDYDSDRYTKMVRYPLEVLAIFDMVLMDMVGRNNPLFEKHIQARIFNLKSSVSMRNLNPSDVEKMISLKGMIICCSSVIPEIREAIFRCLFLTFGSTRKNNEPTVCAKQECLSRNSMTLVHNRCRFADKQVVRVQETPDDIPDGGTPHTVTLLMHDKLVDAGKPGDRVEVTGIYRGMSVRVGQTQRTVKSIFKDPMETENEASTGDDDSTQKSEINAGQLKELSKQPDIYEKLTRSLAPNIWELDDVKRGLLCQLFGGNALKLPSGASFRGDINILLVGDPGTSKSQLLQYIHKLYLLVDPETGETVLESGALVLSDRGICCIDEFDKMSDNARSMLHEVMEQQTVSIAKAGIIASLNARTSVLACANPIGHAITLTYLYSSVLVLPFNQSSQHDVIDLPTLTAYVNYARKHIHPQLSDEAAEELTRGYVEMRKRGNFPRKQQKGHNCNHQGKLKVEKSDVIEAFRLLEVAMQQSATDHSTGTIDMDLITTGVSASERMRRENLVSATRSLILDKLTIGGSSARLMELLEELKKQNQGGAEVHLSDLRTALSTLSAEGLLVVQGDC
ncbi:hypothetical protein SASPL_138261 [Salvia splendens]|uniref:DNA replication licensing factor MCM4 n=1 Tax=Salvia splendens TaxID=180675 RepID=A0A8X8WW07_SALSN|nr:hypothetical protein SASPL_138261 [Salvia splendens]